MKTRTLGFALTAVLVATAAYSGAARDTENVLVSGPVEAVNGSNRTVTVLGRVITSSTSYAPGTFVTVYGFLGQDGHATTTAIETGADYRAGADDVFFKGVVTKVDASVGSFQMGGTTVDYTALLSEPSFEAPEVGDIVSIAGSQPESRGLILANRISGSGVNAAITTGSGVNAAITTGSGIRTAITTGSGIRTAITTGSGVNKT